MDFLKFFSLIETSALYFPSAEVLANDDPFEGSVTSLSRRYKTLLHLKPEEGKSFVIGRDEPDRVQVLDMQSAEAEEHRQMFEQLANFQREYRRFVFINSWHMSAHESTAMWKLYAQKEYGIAIVSSLSRMERAFKENSRTFYVLPVSYIDYDNGYIPVGNFLRPFLYKVHSLEYEHEVRVITCDDPPINPHVNKGSQTGIAAKCDVRELIEKIVVSPNSPGWVYQLVHDYATEKVEKPVVQSDLLREPAFG